MKSTITAIRTIFNFLVSSGVKTATNITGGIYWINRPKDSKFEDIVVNSVAMNADELQEGVFNVNIHVPNLKLSNDTTQPDFIRFEQILSVLIPALSSVYGYDYNFKIEEPGTIIPDGENWFSNIRIRFWTLRS